MPLKYPREGVHRTNEHFIEIPLKHGYSSRLAAAKSMLTSSTDASSVEPCMTGMRRNQGSEHWYQFCDSFERKYGSIKEEGATSGILKEPDFLWKKCTPNSKILMEWPGVVASRIKFPRTVKRYRDQNRTIVYTDEKYVHTSHTVSKQNRSSEGCSN